jgi:hypothetical protein
MKVKELYKVAKQLMDMKCEDLDLIYKDVRNGDSGSVNIYADVTKVGANEDMGRLCNMEPEETYVAVYCDH